MIVLDVTSYRDGGTKRVKTDKAIYWIPSKLQLKDMPFLYGSVYKGNDYFTGDCVLVTDEDERQLLFIKCIAHIKFQLFDLIDIIDTLNANNPDK